MFDVYLKHILRVVAVGPLVIACPAVGVGLAPILWTSAYLDAKKERERRSKKGDAIATGIALAAGARVAMTAARSLGATTGFPDWLLDAADTVHDAID